MSERDKFSIFILSDVDSWMADCVQRLMLHWQSLGHRVSCINNLDDPMPSDLCFCLGYSKIICESQRAVFSNTLVVHASDLPSGKGWSPLTWQILEGKNKIHVTLFEAADRVDSGPIYLQDVIEFSGSELLGELRGILARKTFDLCNAFVSQYPEITRLAKDQVGLESFYARRFPRDSQLDPNKSIAEQFNLLRVVDNKRYPAYFEWMGKRYVINIRNDDRTW